MSYAPVELSIPAEHRYLNIIAACIGDLLAREEGLVEPAITTYNIQLAVQEISANIVDHAYGAASGRIAITMQVLCQPHRMVIQLLDTGVAFNPASVATPDLDEIHEGGYGLFLARSLLDDLSYNTRPDGNIWRLTKRLDV
ncbi:MAG: ATP-binding protein [Chloroflexales bacterium]